MKLPPGATLRRIGVGGGVFVAVGVGLGVDDLVAVSVGVAVAVVVGVAVDVLVGVRVAQLPAISVGLLTTETNPVAQLRSNSPPGGIGVTFPAAPATPHAARRIRMLRRPRIRVMPPPVVLGGFATPDGRDSASSRA